MKLGMITLATLALTSTLAMAQTPPAQNAPGNNAVNSPNTNNSSAPVSGANSFTEGQARERIASVGYTDVSELKKDANGVWRGKAKRGGKTMDVSLDFQGNINPK